MNNQQSQAPKRAKRRKQIDPLAYAALVILAVIVTVGVLCYKQGAKQPKYFGPNSCRAAFSAIADQLDGSKDATAAAIRGTSNPAEGEDKIRTLVNQCLGELPNLETSGSVSTAPTTTVQP